MDASKGQSTRGDGWNEHGRAGTRPAGVRGPAGRRKWTEDYFGLGLIFNASSSGMCYKRTIVSSYNYKHKIKFNWVLDRLSSAVNFCPTSRCRGWSWRGSTTV